MVAVEQQLEHGTHSGKPSFIRPPVEINLLSCLRGEKKKRGLLATICQQEGVTVCT